MSELTGKTIGQYQLIEGINETGSALVYKAFQPSANRYVALKVLKPSAARQAEDIQRFRQESSLLTQLRHPRLLEVYETGEAEGLFFCAERLAENGSLQDRLAFGPQNPFYETSRVILLFQGIVEGLEFIHARGYIHGNLKPSNILLDIMMQPLLSDLGLPGKPGEAVSPFMAPEQVQGRMADRRADVYALGVLLYTTLVGAAPQAGVMVTPRSSRPDVSQDIESVIFKAMAQDPNQRFQSATEFFNAMRTALTPMPVPQPVYAPPPIASMPAVAQTVNVGGQKKDTNWIAIVLGVFLVLVLCIGAVFIYRQFSQNQTTPPVEQPTQVPAATREPRPTNEPRPTDAPPEVQPTNPPDQPDDQPARPPINVPPINLPPICSSVGLAGVPLVVIGVSRLSKKRRSR